MCEIALDNLCVATMPNVRHSASLQDTAANTYICQFCYEGEGWEGREHVVMSPESELMVLKQFVGEHLPSYFHYIHPLHKRGWLSELAKTKPTV